MEITKQKFIIYTHRKKKKKNPNLTLKIATISQGKIANEEKRKKKNYKNIQNPVNKLAIRTYISIIINALNINRLNAPIKNHRVAKWVQKQDLYTCCL